MLGFASLANLAMSAYNVASMSKDLGAMKTANAKMKAPLGKDPEETEGESTEGSNSSKYAENFVKNAGSSVQNHKNSVYKSPMKTNGDMRMSHFG